MPPFCYDYPRPSVAADIVILSLREGALQVLLVRRGADPFRGRWALPGGFLQENEDLDACARRETEEETGVRARILRFAGVMQYLVQGRNKVVCFWDMEAVGPGVAKDDGEVAEVRWVSRDEDLRLLSHEQNRELLRHLPDPSI